MEIMEFCILVQNPAHANCRDLEVPSKTPRAFLGAINCISSLFPRLDLKARIPNVLDADDPPGIILRGFLSLINLLIAVVLRNIWEKWLFNELLDLVFCSLDVPSILAFCFHVKND